MSFMQTYAREEANRVHELIQASRVMDPTRRRAFLEAELEAQSAAQKLLTTQSLEAVSLLFGNGSAQDFVTEDPRFDDGEVWNEIGYRGRHYRHPQSRRYMSRVNLDHAREIGRWLWEENEYVIGSMENRVSYTVGEGLVWTLTLRPQKAADKQLLTQGMDAIEAFRELNQMDLREQEKVRRDDRDGEALLRGFSNPDGPYQVRFIPPELLDQPAVVEATLPERAKWALSLGVDVDPLDVETVYGYWLRQELESDPEYVDAVARTGLRAVYHSKINVDLDSPRGWPTYWPIRKNMARAEKLLRNMSYVAALQAAIALVRRHKASTKAEVEAMIAEHAELVRRNTTTGRRDSFRVARPGSIIDHGPGVDLEAPVSSVNAANNVQVLGADLRAGATAVGQPEFMFSGQVGSAGFASLEIAEGPHHKRVKRDQSRNRGYFLRVYTDALRHEMFWERLSPDLLDRYQLTCEFPDPLVRDQLQQTQRFQIMRQHGAISERTWLEREGLNPDREEQRKQQEQGSVDPAAVEALAGLAERVAAGTLPAQDARTLARALGVPQQLVGGLFTRPGDKPAPGSTPGGPGGKEQVGNVNSPETAPTTNF